MEFIRIGYKYEDLCKDQGLQPLKWTPKRMEKMKSHLIFNDQERREIFRYSNKKQKIVRFRGRYSKEWIEPEKI